MSTPPTFLEEYGTPLPFSFFDVGPLWAYYKSSITTQRTQQTVLLFFRVSFWRQLGGNFHVDLKAITMGEVWFVGSGG